VSVSPSPSAGSDQQRRVRTENRYPIYDLDSCIAVPKVIRDRAGGACSPEHLAVFLNYKTTRNGSYLSRVAAAKLFGLIEGTSRQFTPSPLAYRILNPEFPEDAKAARVEAFLSVPLFSAIYQRYRPQGGQLPPEVGLRNVLQTQYDVPTGRAALAVRVMLDSAEQAGFFDARGGARTHLILPLLQNAAPPNVPSSESDNQLGGRGGGDDGLPPPLSPEVSAEQVRLEYVRKLISLLGSETMDQAELMERIERLLAAQSQN
jgi:hypothetical protein